MPITQQTLDDPNKEIWLMRVPRNIGVEELKGMKVKLEPGAEGDVVGRLKGAAAASSDAVTSAFGGDLVIREESNLDDAWRPLVATGGGGFAAAAARPARLLVAGVDHDHAVTEMDLRKFTPPCLVARESTFSEEPMGEEYLGPDFAARTGYHKPLHTRACYNGKIQKKGLGLRLFPNATREPEGVPSARRGAGFSAPAPPPAAADAAPKKKKKKTPKKDDAASSDKKKKKRDRDSDAKSPKGAAADAPSDKKKKKKAAKK